MADLLHHHHAHPGSDVDVPTRVYVAAFVGLILLVVALSYFMVTHGNGLDAAHTLATMP